MSRATRWNRSLGQPFSKGGTPICDKHEFIEGNSADPEMAFEIAEAARAALEDGQNMEKALKERKDANEEIRSELDWANEQIQMMQAHARRLRISQLRRMARGADALADRLLDEDAKRDGCEFSWTWFGRVIKFRDACLAEIERLRGMG